MSATLRHRLTESTYVHSFVSSAPRAQVILRLMKRNPLLQYAWNVLIGIDQLANAVFFLGDPDETISSHIGKVKRRNGGKVPRYRVVMLALDWFLELVDPNHSIDSIEEDEGKDGLID
jgi:hypothetical protein